MDIKNLLLWAAVAFGLWYFFIEGSNIDIRDVHKHYSSYWDAVFEEDTEAACAHFSKDFVGRITSSRKHLPIHQELTHDTACQWVADIQTLKQKYEKKHGETMFFNYDMEVKDIDIGDGGEYANVTAIHHLRIGTPKGSKLDMRFFTHDVLERQYSKTKFVKQTGMARFFTD